MDVEKILELYGVDEGCEVFLHYGMPRRSGRYPWGSGDNPYQHSGDWLSQVDKLRKQGFTFTDKNGKVWTGDTAIAKSMNLSSGQFRTLCSIANSERRSALVATAKSLREKGYSLNQIADKMGYDNDSSVRSLLNEHSEARMNAAQNTANFLKQQVDSKGMIEVGAGVELHLGLRSRERMDEALYRLQLEGYEVYSGRVDQLTNPGKKTTITVLCPPGTQHKEIYNLDNIHFIQEDYVSHDGGDTFDPKFVYPKSMDSKRIKIQYSEDGGLAKDGLIEIRRGVPDLSLGESRYAQVRVLVDGTHYMKGMAVYSDDMPKGVDVVFNTNKPRGTDMKDVLKPISTDDPKNPFGSLIKSGINDPDNPGVKRGGQSYYYDENGKKQLSLINKRAEEGDWGEWAKKLSAQFLAKQDKALIDKQLKMTMADRDEEYEKLCSITNPTLKKKLLTSFADDCDAAAVHLKAAALPRQKYQVILPLTTIKDNEVYAPNYNDGEKVALVRYPHGGTFEIPILTVNNKNKEGRKVLTTTPIDAIGISKKVADRLSGADFDGDTVMVIPTNDKIKITSTPQLEGLIGFDPKLEYGGKPKGTFKELSKSATQREMGIVSNLITDMTIKGATRDKLARAVRHSMVVIDANKHHLDYQQSEKDNGIKALKDEYQDGGGASTLISLSKSSERVPKRQGSYSIDPKTGEKVWKEADDARYEKVHINKRTGEKIVTQEIRTQESTKMAETRDARTLSTGHMAEEAYATYANHLKNLANSARKTVLSTGNLKQDSTAKKKYEKEVSSLDAKLLEAEKNAPVERQAQIIGNRRVNSITKSNPDIEKKELKKIRNRELNEARNLVGAKRHPIEITDNEWKAVQSGAISENKLKRILDKTDTDQLKERALPRASAGLSQAKINLIKTMQASDYTTEQIAERLGVSASTVTKYLK